MNEMYSLPFVRFARRQDAFYTETPLRAYDHRLFYCLEGSAHIEVEGVGYKLRRGSLLLWHSGASYRYHSFDRFGAIALNFDATGEHKALTTPISPVREENFDSRELLECAPLPFSIPDVFFGESCEALYPLLYRILDEFSCKRIGFESVCGASLLELLVMLGRAASAGDAGNMRITADDILHYIRTHLESPLTYESIGHALHYHPNHINRIVGKSTGMSFHRYVRHCRIELAIHLLESTDLPIGEIAERLCFADVKSFSRCFKLATGHTPTSFRGK